MKQIVFKKLLIKNFLSVGTDPIIIDFVKGINVITGINLDKEGSKNGVGKSVICDSINFCLFGETIRELKKSHIKNRFSSDTCEVNLTFDVIDSNNTFSYSLTRKIDPTSVQLLQTAPTSIDITKSTIPLTNEQICKLINCTQEVFQQSILMSINSTLPFMAQKKVEKRKFIEGVLRLNIFSEMLNSVRQDYTETKKEYDSEQNVLKELNSNLSKYNEQQKNIEESKIQQENTLKLRIQQNEEEIKDLENQIKNINADEVLSLKENIALINSKIKDYNEKIHLLQIEIANIKAKVKQNNTDLNQLQNLGLSCDTCKRPFTDYDKSEIESKKQSLINENKTYEENASSLQNELNDLKQLIEKCNKAQNIFKDKLHQFDIINNSNQNIKDKIKHIISINKQTSKDIENLSLNLFDFKGLISDVIERSKFVETNLENITKKLNIQETAKFVVSEEGVKSFIIKKILQILNQRMSVYLNKLDANCQCTFNEYFEETIIDDKGHECSYYNFSGGERKRIDLAMLFTFQDIRRLQGDVSINISMYDELLDSSLDGKGVELVISVLKDRVEKLNEAIYIITHNSHAMNTTVHNTIELVKYNGITKRK